MRRTLKYRATLAAIFLLGGCPSQSGTAQQEDLALPPGQRDLLAVCPQEAPDPSSPVLGRILQGTPERIPAGSIYTTGTLPALPPKLPDGPGKELVESFCVGCHSLRYIAMQPPLSAQQWAKEVDKMVRDYGAVVGDEARSQILSYLQMNFAEAAVPMRP
jgi:hypothetical protein